MNPLVSVIIPAYNSERYIGRCLDSLIAQTYKNWEAIIVLAPSSDNTFDEIRKRFCANIHVIREERKTNCATARNIGFAESKGEYVAFLDSDDHYDPHFIEVVIRSIKQANYAASWFIADLPSENIPHQIHPNDIDCIGIVGSMVFRKSFLEKIILRDGHLFNPRLDQSDDADLTIRIKKEPAIEVPQYLFYSVWRSDGLTESASDLKRKLLILKICLSNRAFGLLFYFAKNRILLEINRTFHIDIVEWRKK